MKEDLYSTFEAARVGGVNLFDTAEVMFPALPLRSQVFVKLQVSYDIPAGNQSCLRFPMTFLTRWVGCQVYGYQSIKENGQSEQLVGKFARRAVDLPLDGPRPVLASKVPPLQTPHAAFFVQLDVQHR